MTVTITYRNSGSQRFDVFSELLDFYILSPKEKNNSIEREISFIYCSRISITGSVMAEFHCKCILVAFVFAIFSCFTVHSIASLFIGLMRPFLTFRNKKKHTLRNYLLPYLLLPPDLTPIGAHDHRCRRCFNHICA